MPLSKHLFNGQQDRADHYGQLSKGARWPARMDQEIFSNTAMHNFIAAIESSKQGGGKATLLGQGVVLVLTSAFPSKHTGKELDPTLVC